MKVRLLAFYLFSVFSLYGCYAYKVYPVEYRHYKSPEPAKTVYVVNPELKEAYAIMCNAGIYHFSDDSTCSIKVKLHPVVKGFTCGNGLVGSAITLGQLPCILPDQYRYSFEETGPDSTQQLSFTLQVAKRVWFWDMFTFDKKFNKKAGIALGAGYYHPGVNAAAITR